MRFTIRISMLAIAAAALVPAQERALDPSYATLTKAYSSLAAHDYDPAIDAFREAERLSPRRPDIHKDLAYTLLRTGDSDAAREEFGEAMRLDPGDFHTALEYAFLCFEAGNDMPWRKAEARRVFAFVRDHGDAESRATAVTAFRNVDEPLREGIARWQKAIAAAGPSFSACDELARLAEQRDQLDIAAANYKTAFLLLPAHKSVLLDLARVEKAQGNTEAIMAALIAASRGGEPRAAETAREQLPARYPYVYEFRNALELDPSNSALRRELAYLLLRMSEDGHASRQEAEKEFAQLHDPVSEAQLGFLYLEDQRPDLAMPLLNDVLAHGDDDIANRVRMTLGEPRALEQHASPAEHNAIDPRVLGDRSYQAGFLKDALRYYTTAREDNPLDASLALKLGWTNNLLHDDVAALRWFDIARQSADVKVAAEAGQAWSNLRPEQERFRTTVWLYPLLSSRWDDLFGYGQVKTEIRTRRVPLHPYVSLRLSGDLQRETDGVLRQALSENAVIAGAGVATDYWHQAFAWFEAGVATSYLSGAHWSDYRGGVSWARMHGAALTGERGGWFLETTGDAVYVSHFGNDLILYGQMRAGYTFGLPGTRAQIFGRQNLTFDAGGQHWANFSETGPGIRLHPGWLPPTVWIGVETLRGQYLRGGGPMGESGFHDVRIGIWYAFTK
ncbi:MAG TPA: tetratricopeptide repeat protein [Bryobacteraceae bacterium]|nr:tetratricopeptide repeat protein [Bryobacteraceae bacterium]